MVKSKIKTISDGYIALYKDLKFDINSNCVHICNDESKMELKSEADYIVAFQMLTQFAIPEAEIELIQIRYGLSNGCALTLQECGDYLNVSEECVRSRIQRSFRKVKHYTNINRSIKRWNQWISPIEYHGGELSEYTRTETI